MNTEVNIKGPFPDAIRTFPLKSKPFLTVGRGSYIVHGFAEHDNSIVSSILVGHFSSIANDIKFLLGRDHSIDGLSTYRMEILGQSREEWKEWIEADMSKEWGVPKSQIIIGHDVWIGRGVTIMGDVHIGNGACVAAGALIAKDVPPYALVGGVPAKIIRYRFQEGVREKLQRIKWWYWDQDRIKSIVGSIRTPEEVAGFAEEYSSKVLLPAPNEQLSDYRKNGYRIFYFCPGSEGEKLLPHVLREYHSTFSEEDKTVLVIDITEKEEQYQAMIDAAGGNLGWRSLVLSILVPAGTIPLDVLQTVDYLITNRDFSSVIYADYAYDFGTKFLYGFEEHLFSHT